MNIAIDKDGFDRKIDSTYQKLGELLQRLGGTGEDTAIASEALEELSTTLEELHVASDELSRQNAELTAAHLAMQAERQRYQDLFDFAPDGYLVTDTNGVIREANRAAGDLLHVAQERLVGKPLAVYVTEGERKAFRDILSTLLKRSISGANEWEIGLKPRGSKELRVSMTVTPVIPISTSGLMPPGEGAEGVGLRWSLRDITESQRAEQRERLLEESRLATQEAQQTNQLLQTLLETMPVGVTVCDPDGSIRMVNPAGQKILGGRVAGSARASERNFELLNPDGSRVPTEQTPMVRALEGKEITDDREFLIRRADGSELTLLASAAPVLDANGQVLGGVTVFRDITGSKRAEEQIKLLARFPSENPNPVLRVSAEGVLLYANQASQPLLKDWQTGVNQPLPEFWQAILSKAKNEKQRVDINSSERVFSFMVSPVPETGYINLYGRDITERKQAEEKLQTALQRFYTVLASMYTGLLLVTEDGRVEFANQAFCNFFELKDKPEDLAGVTASVLLTKIKPAYLEPDKALARIQEILELEAPVKSEEVLLRSGRVLLRDFIPIKLMGSSHGRLWYHTDITERKLAEEGLEASQRSLQAVFDGVAETIMVMDLEGTILAANQTAAQRWGMPVNELIGKNGFGLTPPETQKQRAGQIREMVSTGLPVQFQDERGGTSFDLTFYPIKDAQGKIGQFVVFGQDISERVRAERALRKNEADLRGVLDATRESVWMFDPDGTILLANETALKRLSVPAKEVIGQAFSKLIPAEVGAARQACLREVAASGQACELEDERNGIVFHHVFYPIKDSTERVVRIVSFSQDITERKRAEQDLRESEERYRGLVKYAPAAIYEMDLQGTKFLSVNDVLCELLKYTREELLATRPIELLDEDSRLAFKARIQKKLAGEAIEESIEYRIRRKDGEYITTIVNVGAITYTDEKPNRVVVIGYDVTERRRIEQALRESEQKYRTLVKFAPAGIYEIDFRSGRFTEVNDAMCQILGYGREELLSMTAFEIMDEADRNQFATRIKMAQDGDQPSPATEYRVRAKDGHIIWGLLNVTFHWEAGKITSATVIANDVTERKQAEEIVRESETRLKRVFESGLLGVIFWTMAGEITDANDKFLQMTGYTREDLKAGRIDWARMTPAEYRSLDEASMVELKATGMNAKPFEKAYVRKDGTRFPILLAGAMLDEARSNGVAFVLDMTERKQAEEKLRASNDELRRFNTAMIGRELRMVELKNEINELCRRAGLPERYAKDEEEQKR